MFDVTLSRTSSNSSSSSYTGKSDDTRATTPDSDTDSSSLSHLLAPSVHDAATLSGLFDAKVVARFLGLCLFTRANDGNESASRAFVARCLGVHCPHWASGSDFKVAYVQCSAPLSSKVGLLFSVSRICSLLVVVGQTRRRPCS